MKTIRPAILSDVAALLQLESQAFSCDRLNRRSFRHAISSSASELIIAESHNTDNADDIPVLLGYALMHLRHGTSLTRLYSIAVANEARNLGVGQALIHAAENLAISRGRRILRLEVSDANHKAIGLYKKLGYRVFGQYNDYYEDHTNAVRMQKRLHSATPAHTSRLVPWVAQGTPFTCGPASLQMALRALQPDYPVTPEDELDIWREATTIFMTSGHGGCHPMGLALAAKRRGLMAQVCVSDRKPLFVDGVRDGLKKEVITRVHESFTRQCTEQAIPVTYSTLSLKELTTAFDDGALPLILISTFRMDQSKSPHWVVMSGYDAHCIFVHDPYFIQENSSDSPMDCQYLPIANDEFEKMSRFGRARLQATVLLRC
ncbi:MAG: GNAT family N-acetyltransferase/peptidase C39 family protein [Glaciecola sp.]|jgi:ribosomal protein S18 acetylase RimI-like enzyme|nr:GNAT family N-acetyltransferase/peptidase C39 family protein [Glaciecola sp.]MDG1815861.1 GNAT family N-acetyltransferase/peptidase C39 family protein [Glaciecola sp.]MDG2100051.1 GNAT family N-acetyltransferase/peptidase C39 family protein [Glaciecola sp.]